MECTVGDLAKEIFLTSRGKNEIQNPKRKRRVGVLLKGATLRKDVWVSEKGFKRKGQLLTMWYSQSEKERNYYIFKTIRRNTVRI